MDRALDVLFGKSIVAVTGAGISTASGIPDYRSPNAPPRSPITLKQFLGSDSYRRHYWARNYLGYTFMAARIPSAAHRALASWENTGSLQGIITQNIDLLHQKAASRSVVDLHGRYDQVDCMQCGARYSREFVQGMLAQANPNFNYGIEDVEVAPDADAVLADTAGFNVPSCPACGGILKPNVVFFGETVPAKRSAKARALGDGADALLVLGSSLAVQSGLRFVTRASAEGRPIVIINQGPTRGDRFATVRLSGNLDKVLPELARRAN